MLLEDMGLFSVVTVADGRRLFALTQQGNAIVRVAVAEGVGGGRPRGGLGTDGIASDKRAFLQKPDAMSVIVVTHAVNWRTIPHLC